MTQEEFTIPGVVLETDTDVFKAPSDITVPANSELGLALVRKLVSDWLDYDAPEGAHILLNTLSGTTLLHLIREVVTVNALLADRGDGPLAVTKMLDNAPLAAREEYINTVHSLELFGTPLVRALYDFGQSPNPSEYNDQAYNTVKGREVLARLLPDDLLFLVNNNCVTLATGVDWVVRHGKLKHLKLLREHFDSLGAPIEELGRALWGPREEAVMAGRKKMAIYLGDWILNTDTKW